MAEIAAIQRVFRPPLLNLRWSAVFAGLAVGIVANLVLLLIGAAAGLAAFNAGATTDENRLLLVVSAWDTLSMMVGAVLGGYVAARASGMRRTPDGVLHGVLAWSAAMLIAIALATAAAGGAFGDMVSGWLGAPTEAGQTMPPPLSEAERAAIERDLEIRFGLTPEQAAAIAEEIAAMAARPAPQPDPEESLRSATLVGAWISAAVLLSLLGAIGGGVLGSRGSRRGQRETIRNLRQPDDLPEAERPPYAL